MSLDSVLANTAPATLVAVADSLAAPALPLVRELLARGAERGQATLLVCVLRAPETYLSPSDLAGAQVLDLTQHVPGFGPALDLEARIADACGNLAGSQVLLDAADVLAEDYSSVVAIRVVKRLLAAVRPPPSSAGSSSRLSRSSSTSAAGRLILPLRPAAFADDLLSSTLSASLAHLTPHRPEYIRHIANKYLLDPAAPKFWTLLDAARARGTGDALALRAAEEMDLVPAPAWAVQVLVRKATGGAKAITRELWALRCAGGGAEKSSSSSRLEAVPLEQVVDARPVVAEKRTTTHKDLALPFSLDLTDAQRAARGAVPLPYAHEGEGADLGMGMDWSDDEEDDEI